MILVVATDAEMADRIEDPAIEEAHAGHQEVLAVQQHLERVARVAAVRGQVHQASAIVDWVIGTIRDGDGRGRVLQRP